MNWIAVFVGGGIGSLCRYGLAVFAKQMSWNLPFGTFVANILACLILAIGASQLSSRLNSDLLWQSLLIAGFCGGFSTFSTFSYETAALIKSGYWQWALGNVIISLLTGIGVIWFILFHEPPSQ